MFAPVDSDATYLALQARLEQLFTRDYGLHTHEYENFNAYLPEIRALVKERGTVFYLDDADHLHLMSIRDCWFVRPFEHSFGPDYPERAILRENYEASLHGTLVYEVKAKKAGLRKQTTNLSQMDEEDDKEWRKRQREAYRARISDLDIGAYTVTLHQATEPDHLLFDIPPIIGSDLCHLPGPFLPADAYMQPIYPTYCVSHNFKVFPWDEGFVWNRILSFKDGAMVEIRSPFHQISRAYRTNSTTRIAVKRSKVKKMLTWEHVPQFQLELPHEKPKAYLPVTVFAIYLGWSPEVFLANVKICLGPVLSNRPECELYYASILDDTSDCKTARDAKLRVAECLATSRKMKHADDKIAYIDKTWRFEFLPNLVVESKPDKENQRKGWILAQSVAELIALHVDEANWPVANKRSYTIKRFESPGEKLMCLIRKSVKEMTKHGTAKLEETLRDNKAALTWTQIFNSKWIKITNSVKNGVWDTTSGGAPSDFNTHKTQMMSTGFCSDFNHMQTQKINKNALKNNSDVESFLTDVTQSGIIDPYATPETHKCGIIRFQALGPIMSSLVNYDYVQALVNRTLRLHKKDFGWSRDKCHRKGIEIANKYFVHDVRGGVMGWVADHRRVYEVFVALRRKSFFHKNFSVEIDTLRRTIHFNCDPGRLLRPLIVASRINDLLPATRLACSVDDLLCAGVVEYLSTAEEYSGMVLTADAISKLAASNHPFTHLEISGCFSFSLGVVKPFFNHNAGPRRLQTANLAKRAISRKMFPDLGTTASFHLWYAQEPLLSDPMDRALHLRISEPVSFNALVMVLATRDNMEDESRMTQAALDRGLGTTMEYHFTYGTLGLNQRFAKPGPGCKGKHAEEMYRFLAPNGMPIKGAEVPGGYALIGKVFAEPRTTNSTRCVSTFVPHRKKYKVIRVEHLPEREPYRVVRVCMTVVNDVVVGNKFFFPGQKSTCGYIVGPADAHFIAHGPNAGVCPDVVVNPFSAFRNTLGMPLEQYEGLGRAVSPGKLNQYETVFRAAQTFDERMKVVAEALESRGLSYKGKMRIRMGETGEMLECGAFSGPIAIHVVKHMAPDKCRARADRGPLIQLTRAPSIGSKKFGGNQHGEMEFRNLHGMGLAYVFRNMNYDSADKFIMYHCVKCQMPAIGCRETGFYLCRKCRVADHVVKLEVPYIANLVFSELMTAGFGHGFHVKAKS